MGLVFILFAYFFYKALTVNAEKTCKIRCLKVVPIECQRYKTIFYLDILYLSLFNTKNNRVTRLFSN